MKESINLLACLIFSLIAASLLLLLLVFNWTKTTNACSKKLPPGPPGWPIVGNMFDLGTLPHETFYKLRAKYGPVLWLKLGSVNTLVIQSAHSAAELFKNHDLPFSDRKVPDALTALGYNQGSLVMSNYGDYWRMLRRLCATELMTNKRIHETAPIRQKCIDNMIQWIHEDSTASLLQGGSGEVEIVKFIFLMNFNLLGNLIFSKDLLDTKSEQGNEFFDAMNKFMEWAGKPNIADFLPFLKWFDPQGIKRGMVKDMGRCMKVINGFIEDRVYENKLGSDQKVKKDFLDLLLEYEGDGREGQIKISKRNVNIIILEMFLAGSETTSSTLEWAMTELLRNPNSMKKVKQELNQIVGSNNKVQETSMDELPYLQAVVKETLRLHPPGPFLIPRNAMEETNYMGYLIPKNTQVLVNAWAIGRDNDSWDDPSFFKPERFLGSDIEYKGKNYELIPFGSGRRICVGFLLAHRVVNYGLASLIHSFDWELDSSVEVESLDVNDRFGIALTKLVPLKAIPKKLKLLK